MGLWSSFAGMIEIEVTSASVSETLSAAIEQGVVLENIQMLDALTFTCRIRRSKYTVLKKLLKRRGEEIKLIQRSGIYWSVLQLRRRPIAVFGICALIILALYLPTKVFFIEVEGNSKIPSHQIIDAAQQCGIVFGASRREVRSERVKNSLLDSIPELQWAGVNTYGCIAVISVEERETVLRPEAEQSVSSIVADRDGIIKEITVTSGNPLCKAGQAVKEGQVLVSGYTDCGLLIRAERSSAEVFAQTRRDLTVISPLNTLKKSISASPKKEFYIIIGKKLINLSQDSGIPQVSCDKIYSTHYLTLPGGFELPLALICVQSSQMNLDTSLQVASTDRSRLEKDAKSYLYSQMVAGEIINYRVNVEDDGECLILNGTYVCREMIGREQYEESYKAYE